MALPILPGTRRTYDLRGEKYGRLLVVRFLRREKHHTYWECRCDCGKVTTATTCNLRNRPETSCGCRAVEVKRRQLTRHGMYRATPEYGVWAGVVQRCTNPNSSSYARYGGRGITMHPGWRESFPAFFRDVGQRPTPAHQLDRIDNDKGYVPGNVRWSTRLEQSRNRSDNAWLEHGDERLTVSGWSERTGLPVSVISSRLQHGWTAARALTTPSRCDRAGVVSRLATRLLAACRAAMPGKPIGSVRAVFVEAAVAAGILPPVV